eukprot:gene25926-11605_t
MAASSSLTAGAWLSSSLPQLVKRVTERRGPSLHLVYKEPSVQLKRVECRPEAWITASSELAASSADGLVLARPIIPLPSKSRSTSKSASTKQSRCPNHARVAGSPKETCCLLSYDGDADGSLHEIPPCMKHLVPSDEAGSSNSCSAVSLSSIDMLDNLEGVQYFGLVVQSRDNDSSKGCYLLKTSSSAESPE